MFLEHRFAFGSPPITRSVYVDDGVMQEDRARIDALGQAPFDYDNIQGAETLEVTFSPPLTEQEKAGAFSAEEFARTMQVGGLAISWTTKPNKGYGEPDIEVARMSLQQGWSRELLGVFLRAFEQITKSN